MEVFPVDDKSPKGRRSLEVALEDSVLYETAYAAKVAKVWIAGADWGKPSRLPKKIYAHFMGCIPAATGAMHYIRTGGVCCSMDAPENASEKLPPLERKIGDFAKKSVGGTYRNLDLAPKERLAIEDAVDLEIRRAMRIGVDGFSFDAWAGGQGAMDLLDVMFKVCEEKNYPFELTITPDLTCIDGDKGT